MSTLKELTAAKHKRAEKTKLMQSLVKNEISRQMYADMVYIQYLIYDILESQIRFQTPCLKRRDLALADWQEITHQLPPMLKSVETYLDYLRTQQPYALRSHVYVHYLALCYGGKMIEEKIRDRLPTRIYQFDDMQAAIQEVRHWITVDMAEEANKAFESTIQIYNELWKWHEKHQLSGTNQPHS